IINIHPSLLPEYRGPTPLETAILEGADQTGVSLMKLIKEMDAGPVYAQEKVKLNGQETKQQLADKLLKTGGQLLLEHLPGILDGSLEPLVQDQTNASYTKLLKKEDGIMNLGQPAEILERQVRAYAGWPRSRTKVFGQSVIVAKARLAKNQTDGALVLKCN